MIIIAAVTKGRLHSSLGKNHRIDSDNEKGFQIKHITMICILMITLGFSIISTVTPYSFSVFNIPAVSATTEDNGGGGGDGGEPQAEEEPPTEEQPPAVEEPLAEEEPTPTEPPMVEQPVPEECPVGTFGTPPNCEPIEPAAELDPAAEQEIAEIFAANDKTLYVVEDPVDDTQERIFCWPDDQGFLRCFDYVPLPADVCTLETLDETDTTTLKLCP